MAEPAHGYWLFRVAYAGKHGGATANDLDAQAACTLIMRLPTTSVTPAPTNATQKGQ
jgi:hypothetical protein